MPKVEFLDGPLDGEVANLERAYMEFVAVRHPATGDGGGYIPPLGLLGKTYNAVYRLRVVQGGTVYRHVGWRWDQAR